MSNSTKISWTDITWNFVWGCKGNCDYCYAKGIAKRFGRQMAIKEIDYMIDFAPQNGLEINREEEIRLLAEKIEAFEPTMFISQIEQKFPKNPKKIFVNSMSDIAFWEIQWIEDLINIISKNPQHTFQILTKYPKILTEKIKEFPSNVWLGVTITNQYEITRLSYLKQIKAGKYFISFEPLQGQIQLEKLFYSEIEFINWIIIGVETGANANKNRLIHSDTFIFNIIFEAKRWNIPVFVKQMEIKGKIIKENFPSDFNFREFPVSA